MRILLVGDSGTIGSAVKAALAEKVGHLFPGVEPVPGRTVANAYIRSIEGAETGQIYQLF
jgi:uncharacterized protein YbjT (DUF2867 family)